MDPYWGRLLDIYASLSSVIPTDARWKQAYKQTKRGMGLEVDEGETMSPTFDPPATTPQEFAGQYAQAIAHMVSVDGTHAVLPKNFVENWLRAERNQKG
jgi:hypothetical protein